MTHLGTEKRFGAFGSTRLPMVKLAKELNPLN
jgi:hypothetical protein